MKIEVHEYPSAPKYPCLMECKGNVVLFTANGWGMAIRHPAGAHYSRDWAMESFTPFTGSVTLSNG